MKITLAYIPEEEQEASTYLAALVNLYPTAKVRKSDQNPPFKHIYVTTRNGANYCKPSGIA